MTFNSKKEKDDFINENSKLAYYICNKYYKNFNDTELDDLKQVAMIGLIKAVDAFNTNKNTKFATYASKCILNQINMYLRKFNKYKKAEKNFSSFITTNHKEEDYNPINDIEYKNNDNSDYNISGNIENNEIINNLLNAINSLKNTRDKNILIDYYINNIKQKSLSVKYNISQSYISRIIIKNTKIIKNILLKNKPSKIIIDKNKPSKIIIDKNKPSKIIIDKNIDKNKPYSNKEKEIRSFLKDNFEKDNYINICKMYMIDKLSQPKISKIINYSQGYISSILAKTFKIINYLEENNNLNYENYILQKNNFKKINKTKIKINDKIFYINENLEFASGIIIGFTYKKINIIVFDENKKCCLFFKEKDKYKNFIINNENLAEKILKENLLKYQSYFKDKHSIYNIIPF